MLGKLLGIYGQEIPGCWIERIAALRYGITDVRPFEENAVRSRYSSKSSQ